RHRREVLAMNLDDDNRQNEDLPSLRGEAPLEADGGGAGRFGDVRRLVIAPTMATFLLIGGVYWIRTQLPATSGGQEQAAVVQVHLLRRPDAAPIRVLVAPQPAKVSAPSHNDRPADDADSAAHSETAVIPHMQTMPPADARPSSIKSTPSSVNAATSSVSMK